MRVRLMLVAFCLILFTAPIVAQTRGPLGPIQPGEEEAYNAGFYTPLDLRQSIDGITMGLDWAYADSWYIQVGLAQILNPEAKRLKIVSAMMQLSDSDESVGDLGDGYGHPDAHWLSWRYPIDLLNTDFDPNSQIAVYDLFDTFPEELDFDLTIRLAVTPPLPTPDATIPTLAPEVTPEPTPKREKTPKPDPVYYDYEFNFTVKPYPVRIINPETVFEENGLRVTVNQLAITPIRTLAHLCYEVLDATDVWYFSYEATEAYYGDNEMTLFEQYGGLPGEWFPRGTQGCGWYHTLLFHDGVESPFTLEIRRLVTDYHQPENYIEEMQHYIEENGIDAPPHYDRDGNINGFNLSLEEFLDVAVGLGYMKRMDGSWIVNVPISPLE